jgi:hypothetical protein
MDSLSHADVTPQLSQQNQNNKRNGSVTHGTTEKQAAFAHPQSSTTVPVPRNPSERYPSMGRNTQHCGWIVGHRPFLISAMTQTRNV